ncbi:YjcZ family sporulation protein [Paenibacillus sp. D51F]
MSEFEHRNMFTSTGAILVLFILLVIISKAFLY